jgi:putative serine protease PepD
VTAVQVSGQGRQYVFPPGAEVSIGRAATADVILQAPAVSEQHARLVTEGDVWYLVDNDSAAGTWVGGLRVTSIPVTGPLTARLGDAAGGTDISLELVSQPSGAWAAPGAPPAASGPPTGQDPAYRPGTGQVPAYDSAAGQVPAYGAAPAPGAGYAPGPGQGTGYAPGSGQGPGYAPGSGQGPGYAPGSGQGPGYVPGPGPGPGYAGQGAGAGPGYGPAAPSPQAVPVLVTRLGREQRIFPVGMPVRVGRDPTLELVSLNPLVSRQVHGVIMSDADGATYTDQSRRGTFLDGKPLHRPLRITQSVVLRLGDPATGEELGITPPLSSTQLARNRGRRLLAGRLRIGVAAAAAVVIVAGLAATAIALTRSPAPAQAGATLSNGLPVSVLHKAEAATVRLLIGSRSSFTGWGSGTLISPTGLILTNGHVAEPRAPGEAVAAGVPASQLGADPPYLTVELTTGQSSAVIARYRARPVAVDGYLDLAVVQIYASSSGKPIRPGSLHLPYLPVGNVATVQLDQPVTVLGFPGVADSDSITVTSGVVSTFVPDPLGHVRSPRFELETTARVAHGNSGGAAITNTGQLIGVPSEAIPGEDGDVSWRLRSVTEAAALITAARRHSAYHSRILVQLTGGEQVGPAGIAAGGDAACSGGNSMPGGTAAFFGINYSRFPKGLDIAMAVALPDGTAASGAAGGLPQSTATSASGCFVYELDASDLGLATLPTGTYQIQLLGGPNLTPLSAAADVTVGTPRRPAARKGTHAPASSPSSTASTSN